MASGKSVRSVVAGTLGLACLSTVSSASAALITQWSYMVESGFSAFTQVGGSSVGPAISATGDSGDNDLPTSLAWGVGEPSQSFISITSPVSGDDLVTDGAAVESATLTHGNFPIDSPSNHLLTADITTILTLTSFLPDASNVVGPLPLVFNIGFEETVNGSETGALCGDTNALTPCPDIFVLKNPADLVTQFIVEEYLYTTTISIDGLEDLNSTQCGAAGFPSETGCRGLVTEEGLENDFTATIAITASEAPRGVPEPSIVALLAGGLLTMGAWRRRKFTA
jgi:hypothetical protein